MTLIRSAALVLLVAALPHWSAAQRPQVRHGVWFDVGIGAGSFGCSDCSGRLSGSTADITVGATLSRHVLLGGSIGTWVRAQDGVTLSQTALTATVRYYPAATAGVHLIGDLGYGDVSVEQSDLTLSSSGLVGAVGVGMDFRIARNVSLTPFVLASALALDGGSSNVRQLGVRLTVH